MSELERLIAAAEESLARTYSGDCPPPLWWHPYYRGNNWLLDWLNGEGGFAEMTPIRLPITRRSSAAWLGTAAPVDSSFDVMTLTKQRAWGPAPWVGTPFHYEWYVGTDQLGRMVAGESRIVYETGLRLYEQMGDVR